MIWFTADLHLDHWKIRQLMARPFGSLEEMNDEILRRYNEKVAKRDEVYILGDLAFKNYSKWVDRLRGRKHLILGNHDEKRLTQAIVDMFESVQEVKYLRWEKHRFYLSHYAHRTWRNSHNGSFHLYGHSHGMLDPNWGRSMDVGVDAHDFYPVSIEYVVETLRNKRTIEHHPEKEE
jgi:calcineurin-like phosphoesterase family protein